jgi:hypothetical protein
MAGMPEPLPTFASPPLEGHWPLSFCVIVEVHGENYLGE